MKLLHIKILLKTSKITTASRARVTTQPTDVTMQENKETTKSSFSHRVWLKFNTWRKLCSAKTSQVHKTFLCSSFSNRGREKPILK